MKRKAILTFITLALFFIAQAAIAEEEKSGEEPKNFYLGLGYSYAIPKMGTDQNGFDLSELAYAKGFNAKLGFAQKHNLFLEIDINNLQKFYEEISFLGQIEIFHAKIDILTVILSGKYLPPLNFRGIQPFVTAGAGGMYYSAETYFLLGSGSPQYNNDFQPCVKVGLGVEYPVYEAIAITAEASYVKAFLSLDHVSYYNYGLNVLFYF